MRIPTLALLAALALPAASHANTTCASIEHNGWRAVSIEEQNMGCDAAHGMVRHLIDHGPSRLFQYHCTSHSNYPELTYACTANVHGHAVAIHAVLHKLRKTVGRP